MSVPLPLFRSVDGGTETFVSGPPVSLQQRRYLALPLCLMEPMSGQAWFPMLWSPFPSITYGLLQHWPLHLDRLSTSTIILRSLIGYLPVPVASLRAASNITTLSLRPSRVFCSEYSITIKHRLPTSAYSRAYQLLTVF